jgi:general secretion pathway protein G
MVRKSVASEWWLVARRLSGGFTLIEILAVLAILAMLLSLAAPRFFGGVDRSKEAVLKQNLFQVRESLDKFFADTGRYPDKLDDLVEKRYLRGAPFDPITDSSSTWVIVPPRDPGKGGVYDVRSGAPGKAKDGTAYSDW